MFETLLVKLVEAESAREKLKHRESTLAKRQRSQEELVARRATPNELPVGISVREARAPSRRRDSVSLAALRSLVLVASGPECMHGSHTLKYIPDGLKGSP